MHLASERRRRVEGCSTKSKVKKEARTARGDDMGRERGPGWAFLGKTEGSRLGGSGKPSEMREPLSAARPKAPQPADDSIEELISTGLDCFRECIKLDYPARATVIYDLDVISLFLERLVIDSRDFRKRIFMGDARRF